MNPQQTKKLAAAYYARTENRDVPPAIAARREALHRHGALINGRPASAEEAFNHLARQTSGGREPIGTDGRAARAPARMQYEGRAPRAATNEHHRGSRRGERSTSSSSDDPDADPEPHRVCECGCGALLDHLRSHARFLDGAHRMRALRRSEAERDALILHPIAASAITRPCTKTHDNLGLGDLFQHKAVLRSDLAPDGVDEAQLHEWERACAEDMRKARPVQVKTFKC